MLRFASITYLVHDIDVALDFFVRALGFTVRQDESFANGHRRVEVGPSEGPGLILAPSTSDVVGRQAGGDVAFFLNTDDFAKQHAHMVANGVVFREEPRTESYGTVAIFEDLFGMPWDLIEPPKSEHAPS